MRVFTRIVERRSFTAAAGDFGLPRSSVTEAVKGLEARLGVSLLQRTTRQVSPTLDGEAYYGRCLALIAEIEDIEAAFAGSQPAGRLNINVHGTLAAHFILPALPDFMALYPKIELHISEGDRYVDLIREGADCVIRVGVPADSELVARRLTVLKETTCASPAYLKCYGVPSRLEELAAHTMVGFWSSATGAVLPLEFTVAGKVREWRLPHLVTVTGAESYAAAARAGLGIIQAPSYRLEADFLSGALVPILEDSPPTPSPVSILYPRAKQLAPRLRAFIDWLTKHFETTRP